ncbi:hypothetical protein [Pseudocitrobacter vendiensis]|uniref:hypothetical protein n=1 Tax=Pseudocitrobacter vendiensis TaxID=2488306 RepID=UPI0020A40A86|nr:hypothetical protein [Pseudocitrobacter vendiensis]
MVDEVKHWININRRKKMNKNIQWLLGVSLISYTGLCVADIQIIKINRSQYIDAVQNSPGDAELCSKWTLSDAQVKEIFSMSDRYENQSDIMGGYWLWFPCTISGELIHNKKKWHFSINAAATSEWSRGKETRYFGCAKEECDDMFIIPYMKRDYIGGGGKLIW